ncbi:MAG: ABC transporter substrate-binding protein [Opitutales bacterium]
MKSFLVIALSLLTAWSVLALVLKPEPPPEGITRLVWVSDNNPARQEQIQLFNELGEGRGLVLDYGNGGVEKIIVQSASGVGPDIFDTFNLAQLESIVEAGIAQDLSELPQAEAYDADDLWPAARDGLIFNGGQWGYPANINVNILIYNKNVFDRFGVPYPEPHESMSWEAFLALARELTDESANIYGILGFDWKNMVAFRKAQYFSEDGTELLIDTPAMREVFRQCRDLIYKHEVQVSSLELKSMMTQGGWGGGGSVNQFATGNFAMLNLGKWSIIGFQRALQTQKRQLAKWEDDPDGPKPEVLRLGSTLLPHFTDVGAPSYLINTRAAAINSRSENKEMAADFIAYLAGPEYSRSINSSHDALPGNPAYANLGLAEGPPEFNVPEMHKNTVQSMDFGMVPRTSPFLLSFDVETELEKQWSRIEADPDITVEQVLRDAQRQLERLMRRNIDRSPHLQELWLEKTGEPWS